MKLIRNKHHTILALGKFHLIFGWAGNCISPCLHFEKNVITIRFSHNNAICIYTFRGLRWNWDYLARTLGTRVEAPHGTCYFYEGWLGNHNDV